MKIKQTVADFIVEEIPSYILSKEGKYRVIKLVKKGKTTFDVVQHIASILNIPSKQIGYAGLKDRHATTTQYLSFPSSTKNPAQLEIKDCELTQVGWRNEPITLGDLAGNRFVIVVKETTNTPKLRTHMPNYFGSQRFSKQNHIIGKHLLLGEYRQAFDLIVADRNNKQTREVESYLATHPNDYVGALRTIQKRVLMLFVSSYQSYMWNKTLALTLKSYPHAIVPAQPVDLVIPTVDIESSPLPIVGFGSSNISEIAQTILSEEGLTLRSFINRSIPELSVAGQNRESIIQIKDLSIDRVQDNEYKICFSLPKGSYATIALQALFEEPIIADVPEEGLDNEQNT